MKLKDYFIIIIYIFFGILTRTIFHIGNNIEFVTALSIASGYFIYNKKLSFAVPLGIMLISDFFIGNSIIFVFTWSAYIVAPLFSKFLDKEQKIIQKILSAQTGGILFTIFFFLWTNFGVVITTNMYSKNISGIVESYQAGIPFLIPQLIGNIIIVPTIFILSSLIFNIEEHLDSIINIFKI